jgi:hypothetical protein
MKINMCGAVDRKTLEKNARHCKSLKLKRVQNKPTHGRSLALVGGGPSAADHLDEIRAFDEVWGINQVPAWLKTHGINATMFTIDPEVMVPEAYDIDRAIVAEYVSPEVFEALKGKDVRVFEAWWGGPTSMCRAPRIALNMGFARMTFFGCEGNFSKQTHAYKDEVRSQIVVDCGGELNLTQPDYYMQGVELAELVRDFPTVFSERSGGLLEALCRHGASRAIGASPDLRRAAEAA